MLCGVCVCVCAGVYIYNRICRSICQQTRVYSHIYIEKSSTAAGNHRNGAGHAVHRIQHYIHE